MIPTEIPTHPRQPVLLAALEIPLQNLKFCLNVPHVGICLGPAGRWDGGWREGQPFPRRGAPGRETGQGEMMEGHPRGSLPERPLPPGGPGVGVSLRAVLQVRPQARTHTRSDKSRPRAAEPLTYVVPSVVPEALPSGCYAAIPFNR